MRDSDVDLYTFERLRDEFGTFTADHRDGLGHAERELVGSRYREILRELTAIVSYQWKQHLERSALKGFLFHGGVGVGKTAMAKRLTYELCRRFGDNGAAGRNSDEVVMILVDGADVARRRSQAANGYSVRRCRIALLNTQLSRREGMAFQPELDLLP